MCSLRSLWKFDKFTKISFCSHWIQFKTNVDSHLFVLFANLGFTGNPDSSMQPHRQYV